MNLMEDQQAPQSAEGEAKVITLCGSTKFEAEFAEVNQRLTMEGCVVISLGMFSLPDGTQAKAGDYINLPRKLAEEWLRRGVANPVELPSEIPPVILDVTLPAPLPSLTLAAAGEHHPAADEGAAHG